MKANKQQPRLAFKNLKYDEIMLQNTQVSNMLKKVANTYDNTCNKNLMSYPKSKEKQKNTKLL